MGSLSILGFPANENFRKQMRNFAKIFFRIFHERKRKWCGILWKQILVIFREMFAFLFRKTERNEISQKHIFAFFLRTDWKKLTIFAKYSHFHFYFLIFFFAKQINLTFSRNLWSRPMKKTLKKTWLLFSSLEKLLCMLKNLKNVKISRDSR